MKIPRSWLIEGITFITLSILGMFIAVSLLGQSRFTVDAFEVMVSLNPFHGGNSVINIPPIGEIKAATHWLPFQLEVTFLDLNLDLLSQNIEIHDIENWQERIIHQARWAIVWFALRNLLASFLGGCLAVYFFTPFKKHFWKGGLLSAGVFVLIAIFTLVIPFNLEAFDNPQYHGALSAAPWAMNFFDDGLVAVQSIGEQLQYITTNLAYLFENMEQLTPRETESSLKVLHVSDIHNNPAAIEFMEKAINVFDLDLVVDTGDITDYGTPLEADLVSGVGDLPVPYVFIPGNHDSPEVVEHLNDQGVIVLENEIKEIKGLRVAGITDPAASSAEKVIVEDQAAVENYARSVKPLLEEDKEKLDVLAVHKPFIGEILSDYAPVVLHGHTHQASAEETEDTIFINAGTTGASGIRGLERGEDPYSMYILYFNPSEDNGMSLSVADFISVPQLPGGFNLQRVYFD